MEADAEQQNAVSTTRDSNRENNQTDACHDLNGHRKTRDKAIITRMKMCKYVAAENDSNRKWNDGYSSYAF